MLRGSFFILHPLPAERFKESGNAVHRAAVRLKIKAIDGVKKGKAMEDLKNVFGTEALTFEQFESKLAEKGNEIKLANLASGKYVDVDKFNAKVGELTTANNTIAQLQETVNKFNGVDVEKLKNDFAALQAKYNDDIAREKLERALEVAILSGKARDSKAVKPFLDMSKISMDGETINGVAEQLEALKREKGYLFENGEVNTGMRHGSGNSGNANDAIRAAFGRK